MLEIAIGGGAILGAVLSLFAITRVSRGEPLEARSHWGGFGGGSAGWRLSPALLLVIGAVAAWLLVGALLLYGAQVKRDDQAHLAWAILEKEIPSGGARSEATRRRSRRRCPSPCRCRPGACGDNRLGGAVLRTAARCLRAAQANKPPSATTAPASIPPN